MEPPEPWQASWLSAMEGCGYGVAGRDLGLSLGAV
jgi:hypothetical protein